MYECVCMCISFLCDGCGAEGTAEEEIDLSVVGVDLWDPLGSIALDVSPEDFCDVEVSELTRVEAIDGFDDILMSVPIGCRHHEDLFDGEIVVHDIEVSELDRWVGEDVLVFLVEFVSPVSCAITDIGVAVHVSPARREVKTVEVVVEVRV